MDLKVQNHPKADSSNTCTIHSNLSLHKLRGCLPNFSYMFPSTSKDWGMPRQRLNPRPAPPIESKVHSPSFAGDPGNVHGIRWTRHCCLPSLGTNTYPPIQKKNALFWVDDFLLFRVRICWMLVSWTVYFLLIVDCFHQSCQLQNAPPSQTCTQCGWNSKGSLLLHHLDIQN